MSDFARKNEAMFREARAKLRDLGRWFIVEIADFAVERTPGFGNQYDGTNYIPTGRLRGGWDHTRRPIGQTSKGYDVDRHEDGPFSDYGAETVARITQQVFADRGGGISYLENDVAYAWDIVSGSGNHAHIGHRNFPEDAATATAQVAAYRRALARI